MQVLYPEYRKWNPERLRGGDGVLIGSDMAQEWLLPWWWENYRRHNTHPVTWIDFGLSPGMREWCKERGELIRLLVADIFVATREEIPKEMGEAWSEALGTSFWARREAWFKKPLAWLLTPYQRTLWIDTDCEVRGSLEEIFKLSDPTGISLRRNPFQLYPPFIYNSAVLIYRWGHAALQICADQVFHQNHVCFSDDHLLTRILIDGKYKVAQLPDKYHRTWKESDRGALVLHYEGSNGKRLIQPRVICERLNENLS